MDATAIALMSQAEAKLEALQAKYANCDRAIALTHLQTALLWLQRGNVVDTSLASAIMPPLPDDPGWLERMQGGSLTAADVTAIEEESDG